ncbi:cupin domain-containing protein [Halomonas denitrificans]|nr:cupin domain-containing protein [Halomonas denitrificans]
MSDRPSGIDSENAPHNLDADGKDVDGAPKRDVREADFAAEAHGFTGFERAGRGSDYRDDRGGDSEDASRAPRILRRADIEPGPVGDRQLAQGERVGLRLWQDHATDDETDRSRPYEIAGYVIAGEILVVIDGSPHTLVEGDSFVIPADTRHRFRIHQPATVIEATSPPAPDALG